MPTYIPKSTAPVSFNAVDAILSVIHGDPVWGWLEGYAHLYPNQYVSTAWFCAQGVQNAGPLNLGDLLNLAPLGTAEFFAGEQRIATKIIGALHQRLFMAMCVQESVAADWCQPIVSHVVGPAGTQVDVFVAAPAGATDVQLGLDGVNNGDQFSNTIAYVNDGPGTQNLIQIAGPVNTNQTWFGDWGSAHSLSGRSHLYLTAKYNYIADWHIRFGPCGAETIPYVAPDSPIPAGYTPRVVPPTATVADLAPLLFALEQKLEMLLPISAGILTNQLDTGTVQAEPLEVVTNSPINAVGWLGFIVTLSGVPQQSDVSFGTPARYAKLARVNVGTEDGWYPPIEINVSPMIVRPMPPGGDRVSVTVDPPATATVTPILPSGQT